MQHFYNFTLRNLDGEIVEGTELECGPYKLQSIITANALHAAKNGLMLVVELTDLDKVHGEEIDAANLAATL